VLIGYADDTLVLATAKTVAAAQANINTHLVYVIRRIEQLSLQVAAEKTDAVLFYDRSRPERTNPFCSHEG